MITCYTRTDDAFKKEVQKLCLQNRKWTRYAWYAALALSLYAITLCICDGSIFTMLIIIPFFALSTWNVIRIVRKNKEIVRAADYDSDTVFSERGISHTVLNSGSQSHFVYERIKAVSFSDKAAVICFDKSTIAISAAGMEAGKYPLLRELLVCKTENQTRKNNITVFLCAFSVTIVMLGLAVILSIILFTLDRVAANDFSDKGVLQATSEYAVKCESGQSTSFGYVCYYSEEGIAVVYMKSEPSTMPLYYARYNTEGWQISKMPDPCRTIVLESGETVYTYQTDVGVFAEVRNCPSRQLIEETPDDKARTNYQPQTGYGYFFRVLDDTNYCLTVSGQTFSADLLCQ